jgi:CRP-like cAMP-binding protein
MSITTAERLDLLMKSPLFLGLTADQIAELDRLGQRFSYSAQTHLFEQGAPSDHLLVVLKGALAVTTMNPDGQQMTLAVVSPGEVMGEIGVIDGKPRSAGGVAYADSEILMIPRGRFLDFMERHPLVKTRLLELLCARLRQTNVTVEGLVFRTAKARLAGHLLHLAIQHGGARSAEGVKLTLPLTHQALANMTALTRETVSKLLAHWQRQGLVATRRGAVTLRNLDALEDMADADAD